MFCSNCGNKLSEGDNFCGACGAKVGAAAAPGAVQSDTKWHDSVRYLDVIREPDVAHVYALAETEGVSVTSGDDFVSLLAPAMPVKGLTGEVLRAGEKLSLQFYGKIGMTGDHTDMRDYAHPIGKVIAAVACALASEKQSIQEIDQHTDGCVISVRVPPGIATGVKMMDVEITRQATGARVQATLTTIKGKWQRKSTLAAAEELHGDTERFLRLLG